MKMSCDVKTIVFFIILQECNENYQRNLTFETKSDNLYSADARSENTDIPLCENVDLCSRDKIKLKVSFLQNTVIRRSTKNRKKHN